MPLSLPETDRPPAAADSFGVSVVVLTLNEEHNLSACLKSCSWCDDIHVVDSGSTDRTLELANRAGAKVHSNPFVSFGQQRNWAIDHVPHRHDWVFHLDADEQFTRELVDELKRVAASTPSNAGFYVASKLMFMGRWLQRSGGYPIYQMRFFHRSRMRFIDAGHGQREETDGRIGTLVHPYLHFNFSKGIAEWIDKHNRYSSLEARQMLTRLAQVHASTSSEKASLFGNSIERRRYLKDQVWPRLPGRWLLRFAGMYIFKLGFLDGGFGLHYCLLMSSYDFWITLKMREIELKHEPNPGSAELQLRTSS